MNTETLQEMAKRQLVIRIFLGKPTYGEDFRRNVIELVAGFEGKNDPDWGSDRLGKIRIDFNDSPDIAKPYIEYEVIAPSGNRLGLSGFYNKLLFPRNRQMEGSDIVVVVRCDQMSIQPRLGIATRNAILIYAMALNEVSHMKARNADEKLFFTVVYQRLYHFIKAKKKEAFEFGVS